MRNTQNNGQQFTPHKGFEPAIPLFGRCKTAHTIVVLGMNAASLLRMSSYPVFHYYSAFVKHKTQLVYQNTSLSSHPSRLLVHTHVITLDITATLSVINTTASRA
jgi:hypothetical protein